jgi:hypothetical protein
VSETHVYGTALSVRFCSIATHGPVFKALENFIGLEMHAPLSSKHQIVAPIYAQEQRETTIHGVGAHSRRSERAMTEYHSHRAESVNVAALRSQSGTSRERAADVPIHCPGGLGEPDYWFGSHCGRKGDAVAVYGERDNQFPGVTYFYLCHWRLVRLPVAPDHSGPYRSGSLAWTRRGMRATTVIPKTFAIAAEESTNHRRTLCCNAVRVQT